MIKFFRNIRKSLLQEGKTTDYLKYALGEIVLVVIGILIALRVNNWNESRKAHQNEHLIILQLLKDVESDSISLSQLSKNLPNNIKTYTIIEQLSEGIDTLDLDRNLEFVERPFLQVGVNSNVVDHLDNTIEILTNEDMKQMLISYARAYKRLSNQANYVNSVINTHGSTVLIEHQNISIAYDQELKATHLVELSKDSVALGITKMIKGHLKNTLMIMSNFKNQIELLKDYLRNCLEKRTKN